MRRNIRVALRQKSMVFLVPRGSTRSLKYFVKWTITLFSRRFVQLRRMNCGEDFICNWISVKLKCEFFIRSNIFFNTDILNFETNFFLIVPAAKINSCKTFGTKLTSAAEIVVYYEISREEVDLAKEPSWLVGLIQLKWNEQVKPWKQTLRYRIVRNEKSSPTVKKAFPRRLRQFFPSGKKQVFAFKNM